MSYKHLFFDLDQTIAPSREQMLPEMYALLETLPQDIVIVSGQGLPVMSWQSNNFPAYTLGQCGNHATDPDNTLLWEETLTDAHKAEILTHTKKLEKLFDEVPNPDWVPLEDRGALVCFSPIGNQAPVPIKKAYDPDSKKREAMLEAVPFESDELIVKIGGSTSFDYIHKDFEKGTNVQKLIDHMEWHNDDAIYFGDRLHPGGNDESVIGVIETVAVRDHLDTYEKLREMFGHT